MKFLGKKIPYLLILILIAIPLIFSRINEDFIIFTDELIIEEISFRMAKTNNFSTPVFQNKIWLEKPPLYFWLTAPLYKIFAPLPFVRRFWSAIFSLLLIPITFFLGKLIFTPSKAFLACLIILTNYFFLALSKSGNYDIPATFFITLTLYCYLKGKREKRYLIFSGIAFGLAFLSRSFLALTPLLIIFLDLILEGKKAGFLFLSLAIILPWHLKTAISFPKEFFNQYLFFNSVARFMPDFYLKELSLNPPLHSLIRFLVSSPVFLFLPILIAKEIFSFKKIRPGKLGLIFWILIFTLPILISKIAFPWYFVQLLPPFSLLTASFLIDQLKKSSLKPMKLKSLFLIAFLLTNFLLGPILFFSQNDPSVDIIKAQRIADQMAAPKETVYLWKHNYFYQSLFFQPNRSLAVVDQNNLHSLLREKGEIILFVPKKEIKEIKGKAQLEEIASFKQASLFRVHYSK